MKYIVASLFILTVKFSASQQLALGIEGGFYALTTDKIGPAILEKTSALTYGITASYYYSDHLSISSGLTTGKFEIWEKGRYFKIPLTLSYSPTLRGLLQKPSYDNSFLYNLTLAFIPQTFEIEAGIGLGFYDGKYTHQSTQSVTIYSTNISPIYANYTITRKNAGFVPSVDLGFRWTLCFNNILVYLRPQYSFMLVKDNLVHVKDLATEQTTDGGTRTGFSIALGTAYSF